jgi:hypothetical protein
VAEIHTVHRVIIKKAAVDLGIARYPFDLRSRVEAFQVIDDLSR